MSRRSELHRSLLILVLALFTIPLLLFLSFLYSGTDPFLSFTAAVLTFCTILVYICLFTIRSYAKRDVHRKMD